MAPAAMCYSERVTGIGVIKHVIFLNDLNVQSIVVRHYTRRHNCDCCWLFFLITHQMKVVNVASVMNMWIILTFLCHCPFHLWLVLPVCLTCDWFVAVGFYKLHLWSDDCTQQHWGWCASQWNANHSTGENEISHMRLMKWEDSLVLTSTSYTAFRYVIRLLLFKAS